MGKWKNRSLAFVASVAVVSTLFWPAGERTAHAAAFKDTGSHWAKTAIEWGASLGIVNGYEDGTFKPENKVSEPEFLAMLIRAFPDAGQAGAAQSGVPWYDGYYKLAESRQWPVLGRADAASYNRGYVAQLIAGTQGYQFTTDGAVRYLLDHKLSEGKTAATVEGYKANDQLTRAEALQFIRNVKQAGVSVKDAPALPQSVNGELQVRGVSIGDSEAFVLAKLGQPARKDVSKYGFDWYVYNSDLLQYTQIGIENGRVVGLYTSGPDWKAPEGVTPDAARSLLAQDLGAPLAMLLKGDTYFRLQSDGESDTYLLGNAYTTFYYDTQEGSIISGIQIVAKEQEERLMDFYSQPSDRLKNSFEQEIFDLANALRAEKGLKPFVWNSQVAKVALARSQDMAARDYFAHKDPDGRMPWDLAKLMGISDYYEYGENIAAGQTDAFDAHNGWLNSTEGHREALLGETLEMGTGVAFGGGMHVYYTQNFYTPQSAMWR